MDKKRTEETIKMLLEVYNNISEEDLCVLEGCTLIKKINPNSLKFVIKEAILALAYS